MNKLYILGFLGLGLVANAQTQTFPQVQGNKSLPKASTNNRDYDVASPVRVDNNHTSRAAGYNKAARWVTVGQTNFDRQTNSSIYNRIIAYPNGKVSVIWNTSVDGPENRYLGRGTGYNHFDGNAWGAINMNRVEAERTGYSSFAYNDTNEIIMSHKVDTAGNSGGLAYLTNSNIGNSDWTSQTVLPPLPNQSSVLWPRITVANGYMHVLANYTSPTATQTDTVYKAGVKYPTVYSRYNFASTSWEVENITLPNYDSTRWYDGSADNYAIDSRGSTVGILMGGVSNDITYWKSNDNGDSWTSTIIDSFPVPAFHDQDLILDTPNVSDGSMSIRLDSNGMAHCFWGRLRILNTTINDNTSSVFLGTNAIDYWFEGRPDTTTTIAGAYDASGDAQLNIGIIDGRSRYGNAGVATMPYAMIADNGNIYVIYSALSDEDLDAQGAGYRDLYIVYSTDNGDTWSPIQNLTGTMGYNVEQMFGSACITNDTLHLTFMESNVVGFYDAVNNPNKVGPFDIVYYKIPVSDINNGTVGVAETTKPLTVGTNYPNPFRNSTVIPVNLTQKADIKVTVMNILGEVVYSNTISNTTTGINNIEVNGNFKSGFYFYNIEAAGMRASGKMLAE